MCFIHPQSLAVLQNFGENWGKDIFLGLGIKLLKKSHHSYLGLGWETNWEKEKKNQGRLPLPLLGLLLMPQLNVLYFQMSTSSRILLTNLPCKVKTQYMHFGLQTITIGLLSFYLRRFLKKLADDQCSSKTKGSIYHIKHNVNTTFYRESELT